MNIRLILTAAAAMALAGCATTREPEGAEANPADDSITCSGLSLEERDVGLLMRYVMLPKNADDLLAQVKPSARETDPLVIGRIAAVSQLVLLPTWNKAPAAREIWTCALLGASERATDEYRKTFFLDQLRWCGKSAQADRVMQIGRKSGSPAVNDFATGVATELMKPGRP